MEREERAEERRELEIGMGRMKTRVKSWSQEQKRSEAEQKASPDPGYLFWNCKQYLGIDSFFIQCHHIPVMQASLSDDTY